MEFNGKHNWRYIALESKSFKTKLFNNLATQHGFQKMYGGWIKEGEDTIIVLDLQKSNYADYFQLNFKIFVRDIFGEKHTVNKDLIKREVGTIFLGEPKEFRDIFHFEYELPDDFRCQGLEKLFQTYIFPVSEKVKTIAGLKEFIKNEKIFLLPAVKKALDI
jgi:hypothetical protein